MKPLFERRPLGHRNPCRLESGRVVMLHAGGARDVERRPPLIQIEPLGEAELRHLAGGPIGAPGTRELRSPTSPSCRDGGDGEETEMPRTGASARPWQGSV